MDGLLRKGLVLLTLCLTATTQLWAVESKTCSVKEKGACDVSFVVLPDLSGITAASCDDSAVLETYTIQNNLLFPVELGAPKIEIKKGDTFSSGAVTIDSTTCPQKPNTLAGGATCDITLSFQPCEDGTLNRELIIPIKTNQGQVNTPINLEVLANPPLIMLSADNGNTWISIESDSLPDNISVSTLNSVTCTGMNCTAVGSYSNGVILVPLILISSDSGNSWTMITANHIALPNDSVSDAVLNSVTCTGTKCTATGYYYNGTTDAPLILNTTDGGASWAGVNATNITLPSDFSSNAQLASVICVGSNCTGAGFYINTLSKLVPLILISTNGGSDWTGVVASNIILPSNYGSQLNSLTCVGTACTATGFYDNGTTLLPLILNGPDINSKWTAVDASNIILPSGPGGFVSTGVLNSVTCSATTCTTTGYYYNGTTLVPLILNGPDINSKWTAVNASNITLPSGPGGFLGDAQLNSVTCAGTSCTATGFYINLTGTNVPLVLNSIDSGANWMGVDANHITLPSDFQTFAQLNSVTCAGGACIATGFYNR